VVRQVSQKARFPEEAGFLPLAKILVKKTKALKAKAVFVVGLSLSLDRNAESATLNLPSGCLAPVIF